MIRTRFLLFLVPFVIWFVWRFIAQRTGREMGSTPWAWLFAAGAILLGISVLALGIWHPVHGKQVYVPAEVTKGGAIAPGHFEDRTPAHP